MRNEKLDKSFIDASWNEMKGILDREMPIKDQRRSIFFWLFGLAGLLFFLLLGYPILSDTHSDENNQTLQKKTAVLETSEPKETKTTGENEVLNSDLNANLTNEKKAIANIDASVSNYSIKSTFGPTQNQENNPKISTPAMSEQESIVTAETRLVNDASERSETNNSNQTALKNYERSFLSEPADIEYFKGFIETMEEPISLNYNNKLIVVKNSTDRFQLSFSTRAWDQPSLNGDLAIGYRYKLGRLQFIPAFGIGYDNFDLSPDDDLISNRTYISDELHSGRTVGNNNPNGFADMDQKIYDRTRALYLAPQFMVVGNIGSNLNIGVGYQSRFYPGKITSAQDAIVNQSDGQVPEITGGSSNDGQIELNLNENSLDHYLTSNLTYKLSNKLGLGVSYFLQLNKSVVLTQADDQLNNYDNILSSINRKEVRLNITYSF